MGLALLSKRSSRQSLNGTGGRSLQIILILFPLVSGPFGIQGLKRKMVAAQPKGDHGGESGEGGNPHKRDRPVYEHIPEDRREAQGGPNVSIFANQP